MKRVASVFLVLAVLFSALVLGGCEKEPEYINPVELDPNYTTFVHEDLSFSYPVSYKTGEKEGYLLYGYADDEGKRVFGVKAEGSAINNPDAVTEEAANELCEKIIADTLQSYQSAAEKYGIELTRDNFSYTLEPVQHIVCGTENAARIFYTIKFEHSAFAPVAMSFCNVWVFDEEIMYLITFCDVTGNDVKESFSDCIDYIFCD